MISIGVPEQNCSLRQKKQTRIFGFAHRGGPISVTEIPESESPFVQRSDTLAGHLAEIKRSGRFGSGL
jgi:hypothetical protein